MLFDNKVKHSVLKAAMLIVAFLSLTFTMSAQYRVTALSTTNDVCTLRSVGYGRKARAAAKDAELAALKAILFTGVADTKYRMPLVTEDRAGVEDQYKSFFDDFYDGGYKDFVASSVIVSPFGKNELKQKCITVDVCIRVRQLRAYLENNGIVRKFGL